MWINLQEVREKGGSLRLDREFSNDDLDLDPGTASLDGPARITALVALRKDHVRVAGHLRACLQLVCSRCLGAGPLEIDKAVELDYAPDPQLEEEGEEIPLEYEDLDVGFYRDDRISLSDLVNEQLLLEVPMKPVCREDCKGLCPHCGRNRNEVDCGCSVEQVDPRLAALSALKRKMS